METISSSVVSRIEDLLIPDTNISLPRVILCSISLVNFWKQFVGGYFYQRSYIIFLSVASHLFSYSNEPPTFASITNTHNFAELFQERYNYVDFSFNSENQLPGSKPNLWGLPSGSLPRLDDVL